MEDELQIEYQLIAKYFVIDKDPYWICTRPEKLKEVLYKKELPEIWYWIAHGRIYWHRQKFKVTTWDKFDAGNLERLIKISNEEVPLIFVEETELKKFLSAAAMISLNLLKIGQMRNETALIVV